jgi:hypothetical protein
MPNYTRKHSKNQLISSFKNFLDLKLFFTCNNVIKLLILLDNKKWKRNENFNKEY